jgi:pyrroline-5-carboxylate reductase
MRPQTASRALPSRERVRFLPQTSGLLPELRKEVTSPGGTTEAALSVLMAKDGLAALMDRAIDAATKRGKELGKG